jgi:hypothetical protein
MNKFKVTYKSKGPNYPEGTEEVEAHYYADAGDWIDFREGAGTPRDNQVLRVRADQVKRIERLT